MMRGHQPLLYVHARAHLGCGAKQDAHPASLHVAEQLGFADVGIGIVDEGDFLCGDATFHELLPHILIDGKAGTSGHTGVHIG